jgi:hypothetical protein
MGQTVDALVAGARDAGSSTQEVAMLSRTRQARADALRAETLARIKQATEEAKTRRTRDDQRHD